MSERMAELTSINKFVKYSGLLVASYIWLSKTLDILALALILFIFLSFIYSFYIVFIMPADLDSVEDRSYIRYAQSTLLWSITSLLVVSIPILIL